MLSEICIEIRKALKISQTKMAKLIDSTQTEISFIEKGFIPPSKNKIQKIYELYDNIFNKGYKNVRDNKKT